MRAFLVIVGIGYFIGMVIALVKVAEGKHSCINIPIANAIGALLSLLFGGLLIYFSFSAAKMVPYLSVDQKTMGIVFEWFLLGLGIYSMISLIGNLIKAAIGMYKFTETPFKNTLMALLRFCIAITLFYFVFVHPLPKI